MEWLAEGRDADVYLLDDQRVLRRCRRPTARCEHEASLMEWVRGCGYPAPRVYSVDGPDMVLERLTGPTMLESLLAGTTTPRDGARTLVELLSALHRLPAPPGSDPGHSVRHLDLHPMNVMKTSAGPVVIDWSNGDTGEAAMDTALSGLILAQVAASDGELAASASAFLDAFLEYGGPLGPADVQAALDYRSYDPYLTSRERELLPMAAARLA